MAVLIVPIQYDSIQYAVDDAEPGDVIRVLAGIYEENVEIIDKSNITIAAQNSSVRMECNEPYGSAFYIEGNNIRITGFQIMNYMYGVTIEGENNLIDDVSCTSISRTAFNIQGDNNTVLSCRANKCAAAIAFQGNQNKFVANRFSENTRGIVGNIGEVSGNIIDKNVFLDTDEFAIRFTSPKPSNNIISNNVIDTTRVGIITMYGSTAILKNTITNCSNEAMYIRGDESLILSNTLMKNTAGMLLDTSRSVIAQNFIQKGDFAGVKIMGNHNCFISNGVYQYSGAGIIINGRKNVIKCNTIEDAETDVIDLTKCNKYIEGKQCTKCHDISKYLPDENSSNRQDYFCELIELLCDMDSLLKKCCKSKKKKRSADSKNKNVKKVESEEKVDFIETESVSESNDYKYVSDDSHKNSNNKRKNSTKSESELNEKGTGIYWIRSAHRKKYYH